MSKKIPITDQGLEITEAFRIFLDQFAEKDLEFVIAKVCGTTIMALIMLQSRYTPEMLLQTAKDQLDTPKSTAH